jgi:hypothetical protein
MSGIAQFQIAHPRGNRIANILDFATADPPAQHLVDGANRCFDFTRKGTGKILRNVVEKLFLGVVFDWRGSRSPSFVVDPADDQRELGSEVRNFADRQAVTQGVQNSTQRWYARPRLSVGVCQRRGAYGWEGDRADYPQALG